MEQDHDAILVELAKNGDEEALVTLYQKYLQPVFRYVYWKVGTVHDAEDVTSEIFLKFVRALQSYDGRASFKNWLYQIAKHTIADYWRKHYAQPTRSLEEFEEPGMFAAESLNGSEDMEEALDHLEKKVSRILDALPENYRRVLELRFLRGYTLKDVAQELHTTVENAKVLQYRALRKACEISKNL